MREEDKMPRKFIAYAQALSDFISNISAGTTPQWSSDQSTSLDVEQR
jgi:hypothetical protein